MAAKYKKIQQVLNQRLEELLPRLEKITRDLRHESGALSQDFAEQATERENDEVLEQLEASLTEEMTAIRNALTNIEQGTYGVCQTCGNTIGEARLEAMPYAHQCIGCASAAG